jgi:hypothetical protein
VRGCALSVAVAAAYALAACAPHGITVTPSITVSPRTRPHKVLVVTSCGHDREPGPFDARQEASNISTPGCPPHDTEQVLYLAELALRVAGYDVVRRGIATIRGARDVPKVDGTVVNLDTAAFEALSPERRAKFYDVVGIEGVVEVDVEAFKRGIMTLDISTVVAVTLRGPAEPEPIWKSACEVRSRHSWQTLDLGVDQALRCALEGIPGVRR